MELDILCIDFYDKKNKPKDKYAKIVSSLLDEICDNCNKNRKKLKVIFRKIKSIEKVEGGKGV